MFMQPRGRLLCLSAWPSIGVFPPPPLAPQDPHERYRFLRVLGTGHFAAVYLCSHLGTGELVAIKALDKHHPEFERHTALEEVRVLAAVQDHHNVVTLYEVWEDASYIFLVQEACLGGELFDRVVRNRAFSEQDAAKTIAAVLSMVNHCHTRGILCRGERDEEGFWDSAAGGRGGMGVCCVCGGETRQNAALALATPHRSVWPWRPAATSTNLADPPTLQNTDLKPENWLLRRSESSVEPDNLRAVDFGLSTFHHPTAPCTDRVGSSYYVAPEVLQVRRAMCPQGQGGDLGCYYIMAMCRTKLIQAAGVPSRPACPSTGGPVVALPSCGGSLLRVHLAAPCPSRAPRPPLASFIRPFAHPP